jgi:hypothetical protein
MNMHIREQAGIVFIVLVIGMILYLVSHPTVSEAFVDAGRCGVDLPPCSGKNIRCMNGYCKSDLLPPYPAISPLPMTPPTKYPYA